MEWPIFPLQSSGMGAEAGAHSLFTPFQNPEPVYAVVKTSLSKRGVGGSTGNPSKLLTQGTMHGFFLLFFCTWRNSFDEKSITLQIIMPKTCLGNKRVNVAVTMTTVTSKIIFG